MKINAYNPSNGDIVSEGVTGVSFGNVKQGLHNTVPLVIRPAKTTENNFTELKLFLENNGGLDLSSFGYFLTGSFITGVEPGSDYLTDHFTVVPSAALSDSNGVELFLSGGDPTEYIYLDVQVGITETGSTSSINYRFAFEFN